MWVPLFVPSLPLVLLSFSWCNDSQQKQQPPQQQQPEPQQVTSSEIQARLLLSRQIQACHDDVECALSLLRRSDDTGTMVGVLQGEDDEPLKLALYVAGRAKRPDVVHTILQYGSTEACKQVAISVLGRCGQYQQAMELLSFAPEDSSSGATFNAAIAACGHHHHQNSQYDGTALSLPSWEMALHILHRMPPSRISRLTIHAVLTVLAKARQGKYAVQLFEEMTSIYKIRPNRSTYHLTIQAVLRQGDLITAQALLERCREAQMEPQKGTIDMMIAACGKVGNWTMAATIQSQSSSTTTTTTNSLPLLCGDGLLSTNYEYTYFQPWETLTKVGSGKTAYWEMGSFHFQQHFDYEQTSIVIAFQPNRNPRKNGMKLLLLDPKTRKKIGFLLMVNTIPLIIESDDDTTTVVQDDSKRQPSIRATSTLLGLKVDPSLRGNGWSKWFVALWLHCCLEAKIRPQTGIIHKPLLALVLEHRFGFLPTTRRDGNRGVVCQLGSDKTAMNTIRLFSNTVRSLEGIISPWDMKTQRIVLSDTPIPNGRLIRIGTEWMAPPESILREKVQQVLVDGIVDYNITGIDLKRIFLGQ